MKQSAVKKTTGAPTAFNEQALVARWRLRNVDTVPRYAVHDEGSIKGFFGPYRFLSNFWPALVKYGKHTFPSVEHAWHASKEPPGKREPYTSLSMTPARARSRGSDVWVTEKWDAGSLARMEKLVQSKFENNPSLRQRLLETYPKYLEERNSWYDEYWGVCKGTGENHMGKILMRVRDRLIKQDGLLKNAKLPSVPPKTRAKIKARPQGKRRKRS